MRWLIAAGIRDFQAMLDELGKLQTGLPATPQRPTIRRLLEAEEHLPKREPRAAPM